MSSVTFPQSDSTSLGLDDCFSSVYRSLAQKATEVGAQCLKKYVVPKEADEEKRKIIETVIDLGCTVTGVTSDFGIAYLMRRHSSENG